MIASSLKTVGVQSN